MSKGISNKDKVVKQMHYFFKSIYIVLIYILWCIYNESTKSAVKRCCVIMYPIFLDPYLVKKPWGGQLLKTVYRKNFNKAIIGESLEFCSVHNNESMIRNGNYSGMSLLELYQKHPKLFGIKSSDIPIKIKLIDACDRLSLQVHGGASLFCSNQIEAWVILRAMPGAQVILGSQLRTSEELLYEMQNGTLDKFLNYYDAREGDVFYVPAGTLHAIGEGILLYEISQSCNTTYRLLDWGRNRKLHQTEGCKAYVYHDEISKKQPLSLGAGRELLLESESFVIEKITANRKLIQYTMDRFIVFTALGNGQIEMGNATYLYQIGDTFFVPAKSGQFTLHGGSLLKAYIPKQTQAIGCNKSKQMNLY